MDARVVAALIGGGVIALGWYISHWRDRASDRRRRRERMVDVQRALHAEVSAHQAQLEANRLEEHKEEMLARMAEAPAFVVMVPLETHSTVFEALLPEIHVLPATVVAPVTLYYSQIIRVAHFAQDMRSDRFAEIAPERRAAMYGDYMDMKIEARRMGTVALDALERGIAWAKAADYWFSSRGEGPSVPGWEG